MRRLLTTCVLSLAALFLLPTQAAAFCGFYVSGADSKMFNNATMVVMMRDGTKTVLSMQNNYEGPPQDFALVIPVPQVLQKENVKVLPDAVFQKVDTLAAPRLVEYWEQDPCTPIYDEEPTAAVAATEGSAEDEEKSTAKELGVKIEAQFDVGEYNVVVLSAKESNGLETYLKQEKYNIPAGAAPVLKPYIEGGMYFFVAKVDPKKVKFNKGQAMLSPLRFHYESKDFQLPVRLGLLNAKGKQDLLVHILAKNKRYELANLPNVTIPTNIVVKEDVKSNFANFYVSLFDRVLEENPGAVVTEYSWQANNCDPCPSGAVGGGALNAGDIATLGGDVMAGPPQGEKGFSPSAFSGWVLTRLHARYGKELKEDLVFKEAPSIIGGRGTPQGQEGKMSERVAKTESFNQFQGRYVILHKWEGEIKCQSPRRGNWGGPPGGGANQASAAQDLAFAKRDSIQLANVVLDKKHPGFKKPIGNAAQESEASKDSKEQPKSDPTPEEGKKNNCAAAPTRRAPEVAWFLVAMVLGLLGLRRRRRSR